jgi:AraC-like DNA-binding protein
MPDSTFNRDGAFDEEVISCLDRQMIPAWERHGMKHMATSAASLKAFRRQQLPEQMRVWKKKRRGGKVVPREGRRHHPSIACAWPQDDLESLRFPVLAYIRQGVADFQLGDYVAACPQNHFLLLRAGVPQPAGRNPHLEPPRAGRNCEVWWFKCILNDFVTLSLCRSAQEQHANSGHYYIVENPRVVQLFHLFCAEASEPTVEEKTCFAALQLFLRLFLREIKAGRFHNRGVDNLPRFAAGSATAIEMARQYIGKNLNHPLSIDIVAQAVFMSRTNFTRQFRRETGQTFNQYLTSRRLEEARHWLLREACSVQDVCKFVGLKNSRFHQLFKERFGTTPTDFRRAHKTV